jgi:S1-C subfamily serine protease
MVGDILFSAAGRAAADLRELRDALASHIGQSVTLGVLRGGAPLDVQATVGEWPLERRFC